MRIAAILTLMAAVLLSISEWRPARAQGSNLAERLGYPAGTKLLILHADDLGVAHSVNRASFDALDRKDISSASAMVPTPWFSEVVEYARKNPEHDIGLHLTLTSEWKNYRWGPTASKGEVPSLLEPSGYLLPSVPALIERAKPQDVERELRAQIETARRMGLEPTHVDSHMGALFAHPPYTEVYVKVAREAGLLFLSARIQNAPEGITSLLNEDDLALDGIVRINLRVPPPLWLDSYVKALRTVQPGVSHMIVHPGFDDAEQRAVMVGQPEFGSAWRQRDYDVVAHPEFRRALEENGIKLIRWRDLKKLKK